MLAWLCGFLSSRARLHPHAHTRAHTRATGANSGGRIRKMLLCLRSSSRSRCVVRDPWPNVGARAHIRISARTCLDTSSSMLGYARIPSHCREHVHPPLVSLQCRLHSRLSSSSWRARLTAALYGSCLRRMGLLSRGSIVRCCGVDVLQFGCCGVDVLLRG
jgi:hypothetical protein